MIIKQENEHSFAFSRYLEPIAKVKIGQEVTIYTEDAFQGRIKTTTDYPSKVLGPYLNPQTGPIYVEGTEPGDTLVVEILSIEPTRDWAVSCLQLNFGGLTSTRTTRTLNEPLPEKIWVYRFDDEGMLVCDSNKNLRFPWEPFLGTIATAPDTEAISALAPFDQGGNMDVPDVKPGNIVYLPVKVDGAYFFTGDIHAKQGEGELCGVALEISGKVTLKFDVIKNKKILWPRIESPTEFMTVGSARPMEDAARIAYAELVEWMVELGWEKFDAYQALTQTGKMYVGNMVDTNYSMVAKVDKEFAII